VEKGERKTVTASLTLVCMPGPFGETARAFGENGVRVPFSEF